MKYLIIILLFLLTGCGQDKIGAIPLKADKSKILYSETIVIPQKTEVASSTGKTIITPAQSFVRYDYVSNVEVPQASITVDRKVIQEDLSKRTENIQHFKIGENTYIANAFPGKPFYKDADKWLYTKTATATLEVWNEKISWLDKLFNKALATDYPAATNGGDGYVTGENASFNTIHDAASGSSVAGSWNNDANGVAVCEYYSVTNKFYLYRGYISIDTSGLPDGATISAATLSIYVVNTADADNDGDDYINVVQSLQAGTGSLVTGDWEDCGSDNGSAARAYTTPIQQGATAIDITGIALNQYLTFTLNATGIGWISKTGFTQLGIREGHDIERTAIDTGTGDLQTRADWRNGYYETIQSGTTPYLSITYSTLGPCDYSGTGDWYVFYSDNCYIDSDVYVNGDCYLVYDGAGSFGTIKTISCENKVEQGYGFEIQNPYNIDPFVVRY